MTSKQAFVLLFLVGIFSSSIAQVSSKEFCELRFQAMCQKDTALLSRLLSDDLVYMHSNGLQESKTEFMFSVATEKIRYQQIDLKDIQYRTYDKTIIGNGHIYVKGLYQQQPFELTLYFTEVYCLIDNQWKLVSWQSLKV